MQGEIFNKYTVKICSFQSEGIYGARPNVHGRGGLRGHVLNRDTTRRRSASPDLNLYTYKQICCYTHKFMKAVSIFELCITRFFFNEFSEQQN